MEPIKLPKLRKVDPNKPKKKKILLLSDDMRLFSGIGTMSKEIVLHTCDQYDWVQLGAAINHPEKGRVFDVSKDVQIESGVSDAFCKIYAWDGYGDAQILQQLIDQEKPDAILHFTDPRFWGWLYDMENEIRQICPIMYYNIWDSLPDPHWNAPFYASCDLLVGISKQTYGINKRVMDWYEQDREDWSFKYIPHGVTNLFKPLDITDSQLAQYKDKHKINDYDFVVGWCNRNIRRKVPGDVIIGFEEFAKKHPNKKMLLIMHTNPIDENGTDMPEVVRMNTTYGDVKFSVDKLNTEELNLFYNSCDVVLNVASNEGFGLGSCESLRAGTPIVVNVTGGLQDQCGFKRNGKFLTADDYVEIGSLHDKDNPIIDELTWGEWVEPIWPTNRSLQGSPVTPYIFDDRCSYKDIGEAIDRWYQKGRDECESAGMKGHEFIMGAGDMASETMGEKFIEAIDGCFENWKPRQRFEIYKV